MSLQQVSLPQLTIAGIQVNSLEQHTSPVIAHNSSPRSHGHAQTSCPRNSSEPSACQPDLAETQRVQATVDLCSSQTNAHALLSGRKWCTDCVTPPSAWSPPPYPESQSGYNCVGASPAPVGRTMDAPVAHKLCIPGIKRNLTFSLRIVIPLGLAHERLSLDSASLLPSMMEAIQCIHTCCTKWHMFEKLCKNKQIIPYQCSCSDVLSLLQDITDEGKPASTVKGYLATRWVSSIHTLVHTGVCTLCCAVLCKGHITDSYSLTLWDWSIWPWCLTTSLKTL